jgi:hypothetical protein
VAKVVELPNYQLNIIRRRIKALAFTGKSVLKYEGKGLQTLADDEAKSFIDGVVAELDLLLENSNIGIINLAARVIDLDEEEETESVAQQLAALCAKTSSILSKKVRNEKGEAEADPLAAAEPAQAEGEDGAVPENADPDF